jgi:cytochrome d ubiquinol oxidase subunit I
LRTAFGGAVAPAIRGLPIKDALVLSHLLFAFTIAYHIFFASFTIGLASDLAVLEGIWLATVREAFLRL